MVDEEKAVEMFHALWDNFPSRARLIHKSRRVLAVNKAAAAEGLSAGARCSDLPPKEAHRKCQANQALAEHSGRLFFAENGAVIFWAPLEGFADLYVHGSIKKSGTGSKNR